MTSTLAARPVGTRLRPLYATGFIHGFALWYAVEKLFMKSIGFNDFLITIATITYIVVMTTANIPLGVLADRWSRKGVLYLASCALIAGTVICGLSHEFWMYVAGLSVWGLFYACYAGTYDSVIYDVVLEETGSADSYEHWFGRVQMYDSVAFITGALASALVAHFASLRAEFFLTILVTCCAFLTLRRFREPSLHKAAERVRLGAHLGQLWKAMTTSPGVAWIAACLVCNLLAMRLLFEFMQLWYLGLALPAALFGPSFALVYGGSWMGGKFAGRLRGPAVIMTAGLLVLAASAGLLFRVAVGAQVLAITGIIALQVVLSGYLHDAMPSSIRAGASSMVSTASMLVFLPVALGFGVVARDESIFRASWFVIAAIAGMAVALAAVVSRNLASRYGLRLTTAVAAGLTVAAAAVAAYELTLGPAVSIEAARTAVPPARAAGYPALRHPGLPRPYHPGSPPLASPLFSPQPVVPSSALLPVPSSPTSPSPAPSAPTTPVPSPTSPSPTSPSPSPSPTSPSPAPSPTSPSPTSPSPAPSPTSPSPTSPTPTSPSPSSPSSTSP